MIKKGKRIRYLSATVLLLTGFLAGCENTTSTSDATSTSSAISSETATATNTSTETTASSGDYDLEFTSSDLEVGYDESNTTKIQLADEKSSVNGEGATVNGNVITIESEGTYYITGTLSDGQIVISAADTEKVHVIFGEVMIASSTNAPLLIEEADKVFVTLEDGSENVLTDTAGSTATLGTGEESTTIDGTIFSKADLTLNGSGTLTINANNQHGIVSKDDLVISSGTYHIAAEGKGLSGKDAVKIKDGTFDLTTGKDAIQSDNAEEEGRGFVYIAGGTFDIDSQQDGIQAETLLQVDGGTFTITSGGGSANAPEQEQEEGFFGPMDRKSQDHTAAEDSTTDTEEEEDTSTSKKGLKASGKLLVNDGTFTIDAADDSVHSNGNIILAGGTFELESGDDGIHADEDLQLSGANIAVVKSYEGIEGKTITISAGDISVVASDDGINASSGDSNSSMGFGQGGSSDVSLIISGGSVHVNDSGDGLDSNGTIEVSGGVTIVSGPENDGDGSIDSDGEAVTTGGTLMASGSSGMAETFSESSTQASVLYGLDTTTEAGSEIQIADSLGNVLMTWTADKTFSSVQFSSPDLTVGETYSLIINGENTADIEVESISTTAGNAVGQMGGPGGGMQPGTGGNGMTPPNRRKAPGQNAENGAAPTNEEPKQDPDSNI